NRIDEASCHAGAIARRRELRQPAALGISVHPRLKNLPESIWVQYGHQRIPGAISIPVTVVSVHNSRAELAIVRTEMMRLARLVDLMPDSREKERTIQAGIEDSALLEVAALNFNSSKVTAPGGLAF